MVPTPPDSPSSSPLPVVYLHIGSPKSGTTFIQHILWTNEDALRGHGVVMPGGAFSGQQRGVFDLRELPQDPTDPAPSWRGAWKALADEALGQSARAVIISHETLACLNEEQIERALEPYQGAEVHVIYTMRDLVGLLPSEWQEFVKHRSTQDYESWLHDVIDGPRDAEPGQWFWAVHDAPEVLRRWSTRVPRERIHLVTVPLPDAPRDLLWHRFAKLTGIDPSWVQIRGTGANPALGLAESELLRRLNTTLGPDVPEWLYASTIKGLFAHHVLSKRKEMSKVGLPAERLPWARAQAQSFADALEDGGYDIVGDLQELLREPLVVDEVPAATEGEMLDVAVDGILGLLDHVVYLRTELGRLQQERDEADATPMHKAVVRQLSETNRAIMRMRVAYWHFVERVRGLEPGSGAPERAPEAPHRPRLRRPQPGRPG